MGTLLINTKKDHDAINFAKQDFVKYDLVTDYVYYSGFTSNALRVSTLYPRHCHEYDIVTGQVPAEPTFTYYEIGDVKKVNLPKMSQQNYNLLMTNLGYSLKNPEDEVKKYYTFEEIEKVSLENQAKLKKKEESAIKRAAKKAEKEEKKREKEEKEQKEKSENSAEIDPATLEQLQSKKSQEKQAQREKSRQEKEEMKAKIDAFINEQKQQKAASLKK